jgi:pimeloyl-ACP methyl ester carboxylesterase
MPLAALRAKHLAFLISISGAGVMAAETTIDQTKNELRALGTPAPLVEEVVDLLTRQYQYARTGQGWDEYAATRAKVAAKMGGPAPPSIPGTRDDPYWQFIRRIYFYDPGPALRQLTVPVLAIFGELDNNIVAEKNKAAWAAALEAAGNRDHTLCILPKANHAQFEAKIGSNAEAPSLRRFVPATSRPSRTGSRNESEARDRYDGG